MGTATITDRVDRSLRPPTSLNARNLSLLAFGLFFAWALAQALGQRAEILNGGGWSAFWRFAGAAVHPELSAEILALALPSALATLAYAVCGTALAVAGGAVLGVLSSQVYWEARAWAGDRERPRLPWLVIRLLSAVPRAIHEVIWGLFFITIFGLDPLTAILAIAVPVGFITGKVYSEILDETPRQGMQALLATGVRPLPAMLYGLLPPAFPYLLAYALYRLECAVRTAAVLGLIGAGGLGYQILLSLQSVRYGQVWVFLYALMILVGLADAWSSLLSRRLKINVKADLRSGVGRSFAHSAGSDAAVRGSLIGAAILVPLCFLYLQPDLGRLVTYDTGRRLAEIAAASWPPRIGPHGLGELTRLTLTTLAMSVLAIGIAGVGGLLLSFPG